MSYLARLKQLENGEIFHNTPKPEPTKPTEPPFDGFVGSTSGANENIYDGSATAITERSAEAFTPYRWWLIHYPDGAPVEIWNDPPATHAEILERHPDAIAAEPLHQATPEPARACSTCSRATTRGACGEPVASGLSGLDGVICYHDQGGKDCPAWLATIPVDLEARILAMAERWNYSGDDLTLALAGARSDPDGWCKVVEVDEQGDDHANH